MIAPDASDPVETERATVQLLAAAAAAVEGASDGDALPAFVRAYRDWIVRHHLLPGSRAEQSERTRLLVYAMTAAATLGDALALAARFRGLVWGDRGFTVRPERQGTLLVFEQPRRAGLAGLVGDLWSLAFQLAELEFLVGGALDGVSGRVPDAALIPATTAALLFDRHVDHGGGVLALVIPDRHLARPVVTRADDVEPFLRRLVPRSIGGAGGSPAVARTVAGMLRVAWLRGEGSQARAEVVAARLGLSGATLRRRLAAEQTHFRDVRDRVADELARAWLREGRAVERVAADLGYSDAFAFRRAFRRRHGCPPGAWRRAAAEGAAG